MSEDEKENTPQQNDIEEEFGLYFFGQSPILELFALCLFGIEIEYKEYKV